MPGKQNSVKPGESNKQFIHKLCDQSDLWFVCNYAETVQLIEGQETTKIHKSMTKS